MMRALLSIALSLAASCAGPGRIVAHSDPGDRVAVDRVLDGWHQAASEADGDAYFGAFTEGAVFLGTDASERWSLAEFQAYAEPHFSKGRGWTYRPFDREVMFSPDGHTAWFDERLSSEKYGEVRGTGVLVFAGGDWKLAHYNMSFPVPNALSLELVERIRAQP